MSVSITAEEQFKRHSTVVNYAKDMLQILSDDGLLRKSQESCEIVEAVKNKNRKAKERTADTIKILETKKSQIAAAILARYAEVMDGVSVDTSHPDPHAVKQESQRLHEQARDIELNLKKLEDEKRTLAVHRKYRKLHKKITNTQFDMSLSEHHVKGCIKRRDGTVKTLIFDFSKDSPCSIADTLWNNI